MNEAITDVRAPQTEAEYMAAFDEMLAELQRINARIQDKRAATNPSRLRTEQLKAENRALLDEIKRRL